MPQMVRTRAVPVHVRLRIPHGQEQIAGWPEFHAMKSLVKVPLRHAPKQFFRFQVVAPGDRLTHAVESRIRQDKEVIAIDLEVIEPGVLGKTEQLPARTEATIRGWLVNIQRLATTDEQAPGQVHRLADEELLLITVEKLNAQRFVGQMDTGDFARCRKG